MEIAEWGLIFGFQNANPNNRLLNERKTATPPKHHVCIVNQFYNKDNFKILKRKNGISKFIPDVILYSGEDCTRLCQTLRKINTENKGLYI